MLYTKKTFDYEYPLSEADVAVLGIPFDFTETGYPTRYGPLFIREAIKNLIGFDPVTKTNIFQKTKLCDLGDVEVVPGNWLLTKERIAGTIKDVFEENKNIIPAFLGGDHLITLGILEALSKNQKITVIDFDAHRDIMKEWMSEKFNHITWAWHASKLNVDLVQIGCRSWTDEEEKTFETLKIKETIEKTENPVYITIDLDVFDPAYAPEVATPEVNGLSPNEVFSLLDKACENKVIGFDIVECASQKINTQTAVLAANIFKKILERRK